MARGKKSGPSRIDLRRQAEAAEAREKDEDEVYAFLKQQGMEVTLQVDSQSFRDATASVLTNNPDLFKPELVKLARAAADA